MTEYKWGLVEDGEKDEKLGSPRIFLAVKAIHDSDMVLGRRKEEFGVNSGAEIPNVIPDRKRLRRNKSSTLQHTHNKSLIY